MSDQVSSDEDKCQPEADPGILPAPLPQRIGIIHLLGWTALVGFALWMRQDVFPQAGEGSTEVISVKYVIYALIAALVNGADLFCVCIAVRRWGEGLSFPKEPGEWILLVFGINYLMIQVFVPTLIHLLSTLTPDEQVWLPTVITYVFGLPLWMWPLVRLWDSPYRWFFLVQVIRWWGSLAFFVAVNFGDYYYAEGDILLYSYGIFARFGPLLSLCYAFWRDQKQPSQRGWLHAFGLSITLLGEVTTLGMQLSPIFGE